MPVGFPAVATRTSAVYDFIREGICALSSAPPAYFQCSSVVTPQPTLRPAVPAPPPTTRPMTRITLQFTPDEAPWETGWRIETFDGYIVREVTPGTYTEANVGTTITETLTVVAGETYNLVLTDTNGNGFDGPNGDGTMLLFLGPTPDYSKVLVRQIGRFLFQVTDTFIAEPSWTFSRPAPTPSPTEMQGPSFAPTRTVTQVVPVSITLNFDTYPVQTSWTLSVASSGGRVVARGGPYSIFDGRTSPTGTNSVTEMVELEPTVEYNFTLFDTRYDELGDPLEGNGLCCEDGMGDVIVHLGQPSSGQVLAYDDGRFKDSRSHFLVPSANSTIVVSPVPSSSPSSSSRPTVTAAPSLSFQEVFVEIYLDFGPTATTWDIVDVSDGSTVFAQGPYLSSQFRTFVNATVALRVGVEYSFTIYDEFGGGLCCDSNATVYLGNNASAGNILAYDDGDFEYERSHLFVASPSGIITVTSAPSATFTSFPTSPQTVSKQPSTTPSISPSVEPSQSSFPTGMLVPVTIALTFDRFERETGWSILRGFDSKVLFSVEPRTYSSQDNATEVVSLEVGREYIFEIEDTDGDGICCRFGRGMVYIYLGTNQTMDRAILFEDGMFGRVRRQRFVAGEAGLLVTKEGALTAAPSASPVSVPTAPVATASPGASPTSGASSAASWRVIMTCLSLASIVSTF